MKSKCMKGLKQYINETKDENRTSDFTGRYGIAASKGSVPEPLDFLVISGGGSSYVRKKYLVDLINSCEFNGKKIIDTLNSDGCTYTNWSVRDVTDTYIHLYTSDKYKNRLMLTIKKK